MKNYFKIEKVEYISKTTGQKKEMYKITYVCNGINLEMTFKGDLQTLSIVQQLMNDNCVGEYSLN